MFRFFLHLTAAPARTARRKFFFRTVSSLLILLSVILMPVTAVKADNSFLTGAAQPEKEWTIMVYMDGDNNLEDGFLEEFLEMERGIHDDVNVVVLFDRSSKYSSDVGNWTGAKLFMIRKNNVQSRDLPPRFMSPEIRDFGELDMSRPENVADFIKLAVKLAPARHYDFMAFNHGGGWKNFLNDDDGGNGKPGKYFMNVQEFTAAIKSVAHLLPRGRLDILHFELCLMGQIDVLAEVAQVADYVVASPPVEWNEGLNYETALSYFKPGNPVRQIVSSLVKNYIETVDHLQANLPAAMSAYDLSVMPQVIDSLRALTANLTAVIPHKYSEITSSLVYTTNLTDISTDLRAAADGMWSLSLNDWIRKLRQEVNISPAVTAAVQDAIARLTVTTQSTANAKSLQGLSVYLPLRRDFIINEYFSTSFARSSGFGNFLEALYQTQRIKGGYKPYFSNIQIGVPKLIDGKTGERASDFTVTPVNRLKMLSKNVIKFDVTGNDILWTHMMQYERSGGQILIHSRNLVREMLKVNITETDSGYFSLISPKYNNGTTTLMREIAGTRFALKNGSSVVPATVNMISTSADPDEQTTSCMAFYTDDSLGGKRILLQLTFNNNTMVLNTKNAVVAYELDGRFIGPFKLKKNGKLFPITQTLDDKGSLGVMELGQIVLSEDRLMLVFQTVPEGSVLGHILEAETVSGEKNIVRTPEVVVYASPEQKAMIDNTFRVLSSQNGLANVLGNYSLVQFVTSGNEVTMMPNFRILSFYYDQYARTGRWIGLDSSMEVLANGLMSVEMAGVPQIILTMNSRIFNSWLSFLDGQGDGRRWYLIENTSGTRMLLDPLDTYTPDMLEGEWVSDVEIWKFHNGRVDYRRTKVNENITASGTYKVERNLLKTSGMRFSEYCFYLDRTTGQLYLTSRDGHQTVLKRRSGPLPPARSAVPELTGFYSGDDVAINARMTIEKTKIPYTYKLNLFTAGQGNTVCDFMVLDQNLVASFPNGEQVMIGFSLNGNKLTLNFPGMPALTLTRN